MTRIKTTRHTKIVATCGPACETPEAINHLISNGVNVFRMNFSHGTHQHHKKLIQIIRTEAAALEKPVAIMQDLQGPRLRTGRLKGGEHVELQNGARISITPGDFPGTPESIATDYAQLTTDVKPGRRILISDGLIELKVESVSQKSVVCSVVSGGLLRENQGINLPGADLSISPPTEKDIEDLALGIECGVDYVAMSFVTTVKELMDLREEMEKTGADTTPALVAKIEHPQAVDNLHEILSETDAVMVARGDLGLEMNPEDVPSAQKYIIKTANKRAIPVITATQMLDSMIRNPRPTRAETSDVANAILDGSDAVMLSGETAIGQYPAETAHMMGKIADRAEPLLPDFKPIPDEKTYYTPAHSGEPTSSLAAAACRIARDAGAKAIAAFTMTGTTARFVARHRTPLPVYAMTPVEETYRRLALVWGIIPRRFPSLESTDDMITLGKKHMLRAGIAAPGDTVICIAGPSTGTAGGTDMLKLLHF